MTFKEFLQLLEGKKRSEQGGSVGQQNVELLKQGLRQRAKTWGAKDATRRQDRQQSKSDLKKYY